MDKIYVSIASYLDGELSNTVYSMLEKADNPQRVFAYIYSQDTDDGHPKLENLFDFFNVKEYFYHKTNYLNARGVGFARHITQQALNESFKYYLQVDSHTQFVKGWDTLLINEYERCQIFWGKFIFTSYPLGYDYHKSGNYVFPENQEPPAVNIRHSPAVFKFEPKYTSYVEGNNGQETGYFCAGQAFGYSKYFIQVPYDKNIYFQGEEQTLSIRMYSSGIRLIAPSKTFLYHDYNGINRKRHWEKNENWEAIDEQSNRRIESFFDGTIDKEFGIVSDTRYKKWIETFVTDPDPEQ